MAFGSSGLFDSAFNVAHFLKIFSYMIPFAGVVCEYTNIPGEVNPEKEELEECRGILSTCASEVEHANKQLTQTSEALETTKRELAISKLEADTANQFKSEFLANMSH